MRWTKTTLGQICSNQAGLQTGPFGSQLHASEYIDKGIPVVMPKDMINQRISLESIAQITTDKANDLEKHRLQAGDVIFGRRGDIGRCALVTKQEEGWICGTGCLRARLRHDISPEYIIYYLGMPPVIYWLQSNAVGQTMLNLNTSILAALPVVLPPIEEQHKIAEVLGAWDEAITLTERLIEGKQKRKKGLMQQLLTGKVRFPGFEGQWKEAALGKVATIIMGQSPPGTSYNSDGIGLPLINGPTEFTSRIPVPKQYTTKPTKLCQKGDILLCVRGSSTGRINVADREYCIGRGVAAIRAPNSLGSTRYIEFALGHGINKVLAKSAGSTFPNIDRKSLSSIRLLTPSKVEQEKIAELLMTCDDEITLLQRKAAALREQKKGLMQQLLTGKVRVKG